ncbi:hypothetical protein ACIBJC_24270 [Streptomyces sp. NPDC050509]|uniref:hypothetical protein n=1 Tax=Streptomyces sp. NPDC050509 TaxID=3365620 RepID=UPI0037AA0CC4
MDSDNRSEARDLLSRLSDAFGRGGVFVLGKEPVAEGADLAPGSALRWPKCECGKPVCPDYEPGDQRISARLADRNKRSSRGGV